MRAPHEGVAGLGVMCLAVNHNLLTITCLSRPLHYVGEREGGGGGGLSGGSGIEGEKEVGCCCSCCECACVRAGLCLGVFYAK